MDKIKFKHAVYNDVQTDIATQASFGNGTVEFESFKDGVANFKITIRTATSYVSVLCENFEIDYSVSNDVIGIWLYFGEDFTGEIYLFKK